MHIKKTIVYMLMIILIIVSGCGKPTKNLVDCAQLDEDDIKERSEILAIDAPQIEYYWMPNPQDLKIRIKPEDDIDINKYILMYKAPSADIHQEIDMGTNLEQVISNIEPGKYELLVLAVDKKNRHHISPTKCIEIEEKIVTGHVMGAATSAAELPNNWRSLEFYIPFEQEVEYTCWSDLNVNSAYVNVNSDKIVEHNSSSYLVHSTYKKNQGEGTYQLDASGIYYFPTYDVHAMFVGWTPLPQVYDETKGVHVQVKYKIYELLDEKRPS